MSVIELSKIIATIVQPCGAYRLIKLLFLVLFFKMSLFNDYLSKIKTPYFFRFSTKTLTELHCIK